jgi:hypothetical protein
MPRISRTPPASGDLWYIRLPSGRVLRAESTERVRRSLGRGHIPSSSQVRRSREEKWLALENLPEFADLLGPLPDNGSRGAAARSAGTPVAVEPGSIASRLDPARLRLAGVRSLLEDLLAALDLALVRGRLVIALVVCLLAALVLAVAGSGLLDALPPFVGWAGAGVVLALLAAVAAVLLTQMTYVELSSFRPARWQDGTTNLGGAVLRVFFAFLLVGGATMLALAGLRWLPVWLATAELSWPAGFREAAVTTAGVVAPLLEVVLWPLLAFALLLPPALLVEESSFGGGIAGWLRLLRAHLPRVFLAEALALAVGGIVSLALALPLLLAGSAVSAGASPLAGDFLLWAFRGLAATPLVAYLLVVNLFIYLRLRYEAVPRRA